MEGAASLVLPLIGIVAVAAATFYAVSFTELREVVIDISIPNILTLDSLELSDMDDFVHGLFCRSRSGTWTKQRRKEAAAAGSGPRRAPESAELEEKPRKKPGNEYSS
ncbi:hypothetical protein ZIOFF_011896 [Zingiber officinale]|uniref:Uncharacterized protein n=1 Tax=Zingiber officinale TaxID=94328 RepID=A0A8J5LTJ7_ZINOF|nr:hypothetical protein ZIOFF_011896 [Zingiber officinale]